MAKIRFLYQNLANAAAAVASASSAVSALPAAAAQNPDRSYVWRSATGTGTQTWTVDLGAAQSLTAVALANVKLLGVSVVTLQQAGSGGAPGAWTDVVALPAQDVDTRVAIAFFGAVSARHWRLSFANGAAVNTYAELGYVFLGTYLEPAINISVPFDAGRVDPSQVTPSIDGQRTTTIRSKYAAGYFDFDSVPDSDLTSLQTMQRTVGPSTPLFCWVDQALSWTAWLMYCGAELEIHFAEVANRYTVGLKWEEAR